MFLPRRFEKKNWLSNLRFWANLMNVISDIGCVHPIKYLFVFVRLKSSLRKCYGGHKSQFFFSNLRGRNIHGPQEQPK
jgi:hypothetical protein